MGAASEFEIPQKAVKGHSAPIRVPLSQFVYLLILVALFFKFKTKLIALMICLALFPAVEWSNLVRDLLPIPVSGAKPSNMGHTSQGRKASLALSAFSFLID